MKLSGLRFLSSRTKKSPREAGISLIANKFAGVRFSASRHGSTASMPSYLLLLTMWLVLQSRQEKGFRSRFQMFLIADA
jgi:hypothetical protein